MNLKSSKTRLNKMRKDLVKFINTEIKNQGLAVCDISVTYSNEADSNTHIGCSKNFGLKFYRLVNLDNSYSPLDIYKLSIVFVNLLKASMLEDAFYLSTAQSFYTTKQKQMPEELKSCKIVNDLREIRDEQLRMCNNN